MARERIDTFDAGAFADIDTLRAQMRQDDLGDLRIVFAERLHDAALGDN